MLRARARFYDQAHFKLRTSETQSPENTVRDLIELLEHWHAQN
jgi:hypothetical protein